MPGKNRAPARWRLFIAVPFEPGDGLQELRVNLDRIARQPGAQLRQVADASLHLTLRFLGQVSQDRVAAICRAMEASVAGRHGFDCELQGLGCFHSAIWLGLAGTEARRQLLELATALNDRLLSAGFEPDPKPLQPHVTVARLSRNARFDLAGLIGGYRGRAWARLPVREICLYRSDTLPEGARYTPLHRALLV